MSVPDRALGRAERRAAAALHAPAGVALAVCGLILAAMQLLHPGFVTAAQINNIVKIAAFLGIVAIGQTLVVLSGGEGIDLSVGSVVTLGAILIYNITNGRDSVFGPALLVTLGAGLLIGAISGIVVSGLGIPPLVTTLGMGNVVLGLVVWLGGREKGASPPLLDMFVANPWIGGFQGIVFIWLGLGLVVALILSRTAYGKCLYAIGTNRQAAFLSGLRVNRLLVATYALSAMFSVLGGAVLLGDTKFVHLSLGEPYTLPTVAAVAAGGTLLTGGVGGYGGTIVGALLLTLLQTLLLTLQIEEYGRQIAFGLILLVTLAAYGRGPGLRQ